ncbi:MAG: serine/threonine protein phosphatase [Selenomonadaceae bacterium]|nr:serine/threonine protein phosphatase [Selenomonadaceae bacterium]
MNYNADDYERILVVGDIHGEFERLMSLYEKLNVTDRDLLIFLGDYVDRGPENVKVLKWIMRESQKPNVIALCGNHEYMLGMNIVTGEVRLDSENKTLREIAWQKRTEPHFDDNVLAFLKTLPFLFEPEIRGKKYFFCHAGIEPEISLEEQDEFDIIFIREKFWTLYDGDAIIVVGHTPIMYIKSDEEIQSILTDLQTRPENQGKSLAEIVQEIVDDYEDGLSCNPFRFDVNTALTAKDCKPQWRRNGKILLMDTGSFFPNGHISCVDILSGKLWQSD